MKYVNIGNEEIKASSIALGCMRISDKLTKQVEELIDTALEEGINFFDHADIYGGGQNS